MNYMEDSDFVGLKFVGAADDKRTKEIVIDACETLSSEQSGECACCVCDKLVKNNVVRVGRCCESFLDLMKKKLTTKKEFKIPLHHDILNFYDCSLLHNALSDMFLSKDGIFIAAENKLACVCSRKHISGKVNFIDNLLIAVCFNCCTSLREQSIYPPKDSIANGNFIGPQPQFARDLTFAELHATAPCVIAAYMQVYQSNKKGNLLKSHVVLRNAQPTLPASNLPRIAGANCDLVDVIFLGPTEPTSRANAKRAFELDIDRTNKMLKHSKEKNVVYALIDIKLLSNNGSPVMPVGTTIFNDVQAFAEPIGDDIIGGNKEGHSDAEKAGFVQVSAIAWQKDNPLEGQDNKIVKASNLFQHTKAKVVVRDSNTLTKDYEQFVVEKMYPNLYTSTARIVSCG